MIKKLKKKYPNIGKDYSRLLVLLKENPFAGDARDSNPGYSKKVWKIRLSSSDLKKGKRGGFRVIYAIHEEMESCFLLTIYPKVQKKDISDKEIERLLIELENEFYK
ncbi:MAG: hypothetical protein ACE5KE_15985 [Methanosarcinales archaeon]